MATSWNELWQRLSDEERSEAMSLYLSELGSQSDRAPLKNRLLSNLAKALRFRPKMVAALDEQRLLRYLVPHAERVMEHSYWAGLFRSFYFTHRVALMRAFLDGVSIPHDKRGVVQRDGWDTPGDEVVRAAVRTLGSSFPSRQIGHYFAVVRLMEPEWRFVEVAIDESRQIAERPGYEEEQPATDTADEANPILDDFTTLDRVLIDQVIATVSGTEGALPPDALEDLIMTVVELNPRPRSLFHLGLMDGLLPDRQPNPDRPEANDERRAWYLAGALTAKTRQKDPDGLKESLARHATVFKWAAERSGGAGAVMGNLVLEFLLECGRHSEAVALLRGQLKGEQVTLAHKAYQWATRLVRENDVTAAMPILNVLKDRIESLAISEIERASFDLEIDRRLGQCQQAQGSFGLATRLFEGILEREQGQARPNVLADLGLVAGGFRSLSEIRLPQNVGRRRELAQALARGEARFLEAIGEVGTAAPNAGYALAILRYLQYADSEAQRDELRAEALQFARVAIQGMMESSSAGAYEAIGVLGRTRFIAVVTHLEGLPEGEAREALRQWEQITDAAGDFPEQDLKRLLHAAELLEADVAVQIAESMWRFRGREILDVLLDLGTRSIARSSALVEGFLEEAQSPENPTLRRYVLWKKLVPVLIEVCRTDDAAEGLDTLEGLAPDADQVADLGMWLEDTSHYDPIWSRQEVDWARLRLARLVGRDADCAAILERLFFQYRDDDADAARQIAMLLQEWRLNTDRAKELLAIIPTEIDTRAPEIENHLREGAEVSVLFVGGNEVQARNNDRVLQEVVGEWPGVSVQFEHTGWSSNWGRDLPRLKKIAAESDAVVLMSMMRTMLGRRIRDGLTKPWVACTGTGRDAMLASIRKAARIGVDHRERAGQQ